jgi:transposase
MKNRPQAPGYHKSVFINTFTNEALELWTGNEIREIEGKPFWVTYDEKRARITLLSKESWKLAKHRK